MTGFVYSVVAFAVALGILVTVHEFGHFWVARRLGVKVLRFSVGFGAPLLSRRRGPDQTEYVLAAVPLGGYVKMLDEREGEVAPEERHRAFNRQSLGTRAAVVAAGPVFNILLAVLAYWLMFVAGVPGLRPVVGTVAAGSYAQQAGLEPHDEVVAVNGRPTPTWDSVVLQLLEGALDRSRLDVRVDRGGMGRDLQLDLSGAHGLLDRSDLLKAVGVEPYRPQGPLLIARVVAGGAAAQAGLRAGDRVVAADGKPIAGTDAFVAYVSDHAGRPVPLTVERGGRSLAVTVVPAATSVDGKTIGRIGAVLGIDPKVLDSLRTVVHYGPLAAVGPAVGKTWDMAALTLQTLWKMVLGQASVKNISGPITIAEYAGTSARIGLVPFLGFIAVVSISLGILNLLPIPILDGGHLMYYLIELFKGSPVSDDAQAIGQRVGIALLVGLMGLAMYNDLARLLG